MDAGELLAKLGIRLVWFDSLGAKSSCIAVETASGLLVIDPGAAAMQPSYPLPAEEKRKLRVLALREIENYARRARVIVVTHYHYDHHVLPSEPCLEDAKAMWLGGKLLLLKNPNMYINESQWHRARRFLDELLRLANASLEEHLEEARAEEFADPLDELELARSREFGDYSRRRAELLERGRRWFEKLAKELWARGPWVGEIRLADGTRIEWGDGRSLELGDAKVRILGPWFHGVEYDRTGWVTPVLVERGGRRLLYTSDLMGPIIEDYAARIAELKPDVVILDGPPTYLYPYMFNRINLRRAIEGAIRIIEAEPELIVYDHHLLRERRWRERVAEVFEAARKHGVTILTAAECLGRPPLIDRL